MKLSLLQKHILLMCLDKGGKIDRKIFRGFYGKSLEHFGKTQCKPAKEEYQENIITRSLEHLIDRELMTGYGKRTLRKWFVTHVSLNRKGHLKAQEILNERQEKLPLK